MSFPVVRLGDVASLERTVVSPQDITDGTLYVGLEHIESGGRFLNVGPVIAGELASSKFVFTPRHILYGKLRPYLAKIARPSFAGVCSTDILPLLPTSRVDADYLRWLLLSPPMVARASSLAAGANLPRVSPSTLADLSIPLPSLPEQRRIAAILDKADALRARRRAALAQLDTLTQAIFLEMFGDPETNPGRWQVRRLGELISTGPQNGLYKPSTDYGSGTPILRIDAFYDGVVTDMASLKRVRVSDDELRSYELHAGDLVINRVNSRQYLGKSAIIRPTIEPTVFESNMMRFAVDSHELRPEFVIQYLQSDIVRAHILRCAKDAINQSSINQQDVKAIPIYVPPLSDQDSFVSRAGAAVALRTASERAIVASDELFASLQHRAFRGEL